MKMLKGKKHVRCVKSGYVFLQSAYFREVEKKFSSRTIFQYEKKFGWGGESIVHLYNERMSN
jgi:hypothetical protein